VEFISGRLPHIVFRGRWCNVTVLNLHAPREDKTDDVKNSLYEEIGHTFDQFPRYDMKILVGDFSAYVDREDIFKLAIETRLHTKLVMTIVLE
jgi:hypothetical protein